MTEVPDTGGMTLCGVVTDRAVGTCNRRHINMTGLPHSNANRQERHKLSRVQHQAGKAETLVRRQLSGLRMYLSVIAFA